MKVTVTQQHIDKGVKGSCGFCPIALAIKEAFNTDYVLVASDLDIGESIRDFPTPEEVQQFYCDFDRGQPVQPFTFELKGIDNVE